MIIMIVIINNIIIKPVKPRFTDTYTDASLLQTVFFIPGES